MKILEPYKQVSDLGAGPRLLTENEVKNCRFFSTEVELKSSSTLEESTSTLTDTGITISPVSSSKEFEQWFCSTFPYIMGGADKLTYKALPRDVLDLLYIRDVSHAKL